MDRRPNIVILNPDQMRADSMAHMGNPAAVTPHLDQLAGEGISFSRGFCQNPVCTPSRCSFMSGWYPHVAGHRTMNHMLHSHEPVLLKELKDAGYHVWMNQRNDLLPAQEPEFVKDCCTTYFQLQETIEKEEACDWRGEPGGGNYYSFFRGKISQAKDVDAVWTEGAVEFIRNYEEDRPFCLFLPWVNPHPVYQVWDPYFSLIDREKLPRRAVMPDDYKGKARILKELHRLQELEGWTEKQFDELRAVYLGMCSRVDDMAGAVIQALKDRGIYENTAVFFFSDHGDYTGDYGIVEKVQNCFEDCLTRVPFLMKLPERMQKRTGICKEMTELIDFYATAEELAELVPIHTHFGKSLISYALGETDQIRDEVFCEGGFKLGEEHCKETGGKAVPDIGGLYYPRQLLQASDEMFNGKSVMCRTADYKYIRRLYEGDELYDLRKDPLEMVNCIDDQAYKEVLFDMKERLLTHYQATCDVVPFKKDKRMDADMMKFIG